MASHDEVAIVGYAGRLPGAANADLFWSILQNNRSTISWISPDRFPTQTFFHPSPHQNGKSYTFAAGLIDDVWGFDANMHTRTVDVHMAWLRQKLEANPRSPEYFLTLRGLGYRFAG